VKPELLLELARQRFERVDVPPRVVDLPRLRVNLIDRNMNVFVLLVAVAHRDVLMFAKSGSVDCTPNHHLELPFAERTVIGVKRND
jgi:hypothetical protein